MKLLYFQGEVPNFGDDLNPWLWQKLFPQLLDDNAEKTLVAIGTILDQRIPREGHKIIFGTGVRMRETWQIPDIDQTWDIRFLRGPRSAEAMQLPKEKYITDPGLCVRLFYEPSTVKKIKCAYMPHYSTATLLNWSLICDMAGLHYIDPRGQIDAILKEINACERIITEAMHGAIVADALRVPWLQTICHSYVREGPRVAEFKWTDWCESVGLIRKPYPLPKMIKGHRRGIKSTLFNSTKVLPTIWQLRKLKDSTGFQMSDDSTIDTLTDRLVGQIDALIRDYQ